MSCAIETLKWLSVAHHLPRQGRVLDVGGARLVGATAADIDWVMERHACPLDPDHRRALAAELAFRCAPNGHPALPPLLLEDVFRPTGVRYTAARLPLPRADHNAFDAVVNFGTAAPDLRALHEACKPAGVMFHQLPPGAPAEAFRELAAANGYGVVQLELGRRPHVLLRKRHEGAFRDARPALRAAG